MVYIWEKRDSEYCVRKCDVLKVFVDDVKPRFCPKNRVLSSGENSETGSSLLCLPMRLQLFPYPNCPSPSLAVVLNFSRCLLIPVHSIP